MDKKTLIFGIFVAIWNNGLRQAAQDYVDSTSNDWDNTVLQLLDGLIAAMKDD